MDAIEKRQDMNVEYLKNVLVKFLMSENKKVKLLNGASFSMVYSPFLNRQWYLYLLNYCIWMKQKRVILWITAFKPN
jgi:hypothetical protein